MQNYINLWTACCTIFVINICMCFLLSETPGSMNLPVFAPILNSCILLLFYRACCALYNIPHKMVFTRYLLVLILLVMVVYLGNFSPLIIIVATLGYQVLLIAATTYIILLKWKIPMKEKTIGLIGITAGGLYLFYCSSTFMFGPLGKAEMLGLIICLLFANFAFTVIYKSQITRNVEINESYLHILTENAADIIFHYIFTPYPGFSYISASVEKITGYKQELFYKDPKLHLALTHEDDREIMEAAFSQAASETNKNFVRWQRKDGEYIYLEFHNSPTYAGDELISIEGIFRDITDRKTAEQELIESKKSRQILLSYISHELRTPMTYIIGYAEALHKDHFDSEAKKRNAIELIWTKTVFLQKLVEDLFLLSKMETNQFSYEFMQTRVSELFGALNEQYEKHFSDEPIRFASHMDQQLQDERYEVLVDRKRIEQVFHNLLHNAVKHTGEKGLITSYCLLDEKKQCVIFRIKDTGEGISKEEQALIFKRFYQGENHTSRAGGSGLGLSLAQLIVKAHRGEISVRSAKGAGSEFQFTIPLYVEKP